MRLRLRSVVSALVAAHALFIFVVHFTVWTDEPDALECRADATVGQLTVSPRRHRPPGCIPCEGTADATAGGHEEGDEQGARCTLPLDWLLLEVQRSGADALLVSGEGARLRVASRSEGWRSCSGIELVGQILAARRSGAACPCGNGAGSDEGCANSGGAGATLVASGWVSVSSDDLAFEAANLVAGQAALLFVGQNALAGGDGISFGDGLRCAGGAVIRLGTQSADAGGVASYGPGLAALGAWTAGDARYFQVWYRDPVGGPCGAGFNLSAGVEARFYP